MQILIVNMLLLVLINSLFVLVLKRRGYKFDCLGCGITAFCGDSPADPMTLKMIMLYNMERGEDGTGWAVNNVVTKDTEKVAKFLQQHPLLITENDENFTFVGHARKCSSGGKLNKALVHPFSIYREGVEKEKSDIILAMNGTLTNTEAMSEEFGIPYKEYVNSDTEIIAKAMAKLGEKEYIKAIEGYEGTATLVFFTPKHPNTLMVYKDPQRTLFGWQKDKDQMYISSMEEPLLSIGATKDKVFPFEDGFLFRISKGKITKKEKIERSPLKVKAKYTKRASYTSYPNVGPRVNSRLPFYEANERLNIEDFDATSISITGGKNKHKGKNNTVYVVVDKYYRNGHEMQGKYYITKSGEVVDISNMEGRPYFFIFGYMCKDESSYNKLIQMSAETVKSDFSLKSFKEIRLSTIINNFEYPIITLVNNKEKWLVPKHISEKFYGKGSKHQVDMFLHTMIYTLVYTGEWTKTTQADICNLSEIKDKEIISPTPLNSNTDVDSNCILNINKRIPVLEQVKYLRDLIKLEFSNSSNYYYVRMRSDVYKVNPSSTLRQHFYITLLRLFLDDNFLSKDKHRALIEKGKNCDYSDNNFVTAVNSVLTEYVNFIKGSTPIIAKEPNNKLEVLVGLSSEEKIKELDKPYTSLSEEDIVKSICDANGFYKKKAFQADIFDTNYEDFDKFIVDWCTTDKHEDMFPILEGMMLCFNTLGQITDTQFLEWYELENLERRLRARELFISWTETFKDKADNVVNEANKIINKENSKEEETVIEETWTPEQFEEETRGNMETMINGMRDYYNDMEVDEELETEYIKTCKKELAYTINFLERKLLKTKSKVK
jgi:Glutamine amidotransferase domain